MTNKQKNIAAYKKDRNLLYRLFLMSYLLYPIVLISKFSLSPDVFVLLVIAVLYITIRLLMISKWHFMLLWMPVLAAILTALTMLALFGLPLWFLPEYNLSTSQLNFAYASFATGLLLSAITGTYAFIKTQDKFMNIADTKLILKHHLKIKILVNGKEKHICAEGENGEYVS